VTYDARAANPKDGTQFGNSLLPNSIRNRYRPILYLVSVDPSRPPDPLCMELVLEVLAGGPVGIE
jgi:hypothetical protein